MTVKTQSAIRGLVLFATGIVALMVATIVWGDEAPIPQLWGAVITAVELWLTGWKLTSRRPGPDSWRVHGGFFAFGLFVLIGGVTFAATGGRSGHLAVRAIGVVVPAAGLLVLVAEAHDFRLWRAEVRQRR